jgi:TRAP-type C4-dicarboxylate transport system permease small subunit
MIPTATILVYLGSAIFLVLLVWKSRDFFKEAWNDAHANGFPPRKCLYVAIAYTTLLWLLIVGSFIVFGLTAIKTDSLPLGLMTMAVYSVVVIGLIIRMAASMPIKAGKGPRGDGAPEGKPSADG